MPNSTDRRTFLARVGSVAAGVVLSPVVARGARSGRGGGERGPSGSGSFLDWRALRDGVFATDLGGTGGNCMIVGGRDGSLLIDTKFPVFAGQLARDAAGLTGKPLTRVINTHHHGDHTGGNLVFVGRMPVIAHEAAVPRVLAGFDRMRAGVLRAGQSLGRIPEPGRGAVSRDVEKLTSNIDALTPGSFSPDTTVGTGRTGIDLGGRWVEMIHLGRRAHTDNDLVIHLPGENVVHTGDLVFNGLFPFFDPSCADTRGWIESLRGVLDLCDDETVVVPGHGEITDIDGVRRQLRYMEQLWEAVEQAYDAGEPIEEIRENVWPFMEGLGFESIRQRGIEFVYEQVRASKS